MIYEFKVVDEGDYQPPRIKVITTKGDENFLKNTLDSVNLQRKEAKEIFQVINDLDDNSIEIGQKIKVIY